MILCLPSLRALLILVGALCLLTAPARAEPDLQTAALRLMDAYVHGDWAGVERGLSAQQVIVYGTDVAETFRGIDEVKTLFQLDQKLWAGAASFGEWTDLSSVRSGDLATLFFNRIFIVDGSRTAVRFATVWRLEGSEWKLAQLSNTVPTAGQAARRP